MKIKLFVLLVEAFWFTKFHKSETKPDITCNRIKIGFVILIGMGK